MPKLFPTVVKRIAAAVGVNFKGLASFGLEQRTRLAGVFSRASAGAAVTNVVGDLVTRQSPGAAVLQTRITLTHTGDAVTGAEDAASDWDNPGNAGGPPNGTVATLTEGLVLTQGTLYTTFASQVNRDALTITKVEVLSYHRTAGIQLLASALTVGHRQGNLGVITTIEAINNNEDHLVTPQVYDITDDLRDVVTGEIDWADLGTIQITYQGTILVDIGLTQYSVDTAQLRITAESIE